MRLIKTGVHIFLCLSCLYLIWGAFSELKLQSWIEKNDKCDARITYDGLDWLNETQAWIYTEERRRGNYYPWAKQIDEWQALAILAVGAGFLGGTVRELRSRMRGNRNNRNASSHAFLGAVTGGALLAVSALYPAILTECDLKFRPTVLIALCFLGGAFSDEAWAFLRQLTRKILTGGT